MSSSWTQRRNPLGLIAGPERAQHLASETDPAGLTTVDSGGIGPRERETIITQEIPVKVLPESAVAGLHEPRCRDPDVNIILPSLSQLKSISDRFNKLAVDARLSTSTSTSFAPPPSANSVSSPKLELWANMHGSLKLGIQTDALRISSVWVDLHNPALDPEQLSPTEIEQLPSERMRALDPDDEDAWAKVRIDGKDWARVLSIGRLSPKVVACEFCPHVILVVLSPALYMRYRFMFVALIGFLLIDTRLRTSDRSHSVRLLAW